MKQSKRIWFRFYRLLLLFYFIFILFFAVHHNFSNIDRWCQWRRELLASDAYAPDPALEKNKRPHMTILPWALKQLFAWISRFDEIAAKITPVGLNGVFFFCRLYRKKRVLVVPRSRKKKYKRTVLTINVRCPAQNRIYHEKWFFFFFFKRRHHLHRIWFFFFYY